MHVCVITICKLWGESLRLMLPPNSYLASLRFYLCIHIHTHTILSWVPIYWPVPRGRWTSGLDISQLPHPGIEPRWGHTDSRSVTLTATLPFTWVLCLRTCVCVTTICVLQGENFTLLLPYLLACAPVQASERLEHTSSNIKGSWTCQSFKHAYLQIHTLWMKIIQVFESNLAEIWIDESQINEESL